MSIPTVPVNLGSIITDPKVRKIIYVAYGIVAFVAAAVTVGFLASTAVFPQWLTITNQVLGFIGTGVAVLAASNAPTDAKVAAAATILPAAVIEPVNTTGD